MKRLILIALFLCVAVSAQASKVITPSPTGHGVYAELDGENIFTDIQIAPGWQLTFPSVKGYPDTFTLRNLTDVEVTQYVPDSLTSNITKTVIPNVLTITEDTTILNFFDTVLMDATDNAVTATLSSAPYTGQTHNIKSINAANTCEVDGNGNTIDGDATPELILDETITIQYDGTEWRIL
jgi:hypothetical protein